ncbi:MRL1 [Candida oxycetoniae]|uniref:MRL1 n=1 Tax=Candida oxycetoniae TaxID=497107 RepID=A0AAI9T0X6_9ASCO|nr:MRL1 [Candida oxycetoniae]KAI3406377.2 MRL1 [Candida oxycetoniae]
MTSISQMAFTSNSQDSDSFSSHPKQETVVLEDSQKSKQVFEEAKKTVVLEDSQKSKQVLEEAKETVLDPCTVFHPISKGFIDLSGLSSFGNENKPMPWNSRGYDSGKNYTIGICSNPFKKHHDNLNEIQDNVNATNIGAFYVDPVTNKYVSIGEFSTEPKFRGRKLTLTYENGSYCDAQDSKTGNRLRKATILTFTCDREMSARAVISYIGNFNDCSYFFEVKSHHACPTAAKANNLAAVWIFLLIFCAALLVYLSGGLLYRQMKLNKTTRIGKV